MTPKYLIICALLVRAVSLSGQDNLPGSGNCLSIDRSGTSEFVELGTSFTNLNFPVTLTAWANSTPWTSGPANAIITTSNGNNNYYGFWLKVRSDRINAGFGNGMNGYTPAGRKSKLIPVSGMHNFWYHVAAVFHSANDIRVYLNGIEMSGNYDGSATFSVNNPTGQAFIGRKIASANRYYEGEVDEITVWDRALAVSDIRSLMCKKLTGNEPGLLAYYRMDESSGSTVYDSGPNGIDGTMSGNPQYVTSGAYIGDTSVYEYQGSSSPWTAGSVEYENDEGEILSVAGFSGNLHGVQLYEVKDYPQDSTGLSTGCCPERYYGVFLANTDPSTNDYDLRKTVSTDSGSLGFYERDGNDDSPWRPDQGPVINDRFEAGVSDHGEYIFGTYIEEEDTVEMNVELRIPNIFTPNGDGYNDLLTVHAENLASYSIIIYNRWGAEVFRSDEENDHWDGSIAGKPASEGVYYLLVRANGLDGSELREKAAIHLVR